MCYTCVTCNLWNINLANKLNSLSLVLHKTLKTLEQLDARQSKLLLKNFEFHRKEIFSKDDSIEYLLETKTTVLDGIISMKNQEEPQEKIHKKNVLQQQKQHKTYKDNNNNMFYMSATPAITNHNLSMKFFNQPSDQIAAKAVIPRCSVKKVFLEILQNSQENTCARDSLLTKLQA